MKPLFVLLGLIFLMAVPAVAAKEKKEASRGGPRYTIEYDKIPGDVILSSRIKPDYPRKLREAGVQGDAIVSFVVEGNGSVGNVWGDCPLHPELARLAAMAVKQWKFVATYSRPGVTTRISTSVLIKFRLTDTPKTSAP